MHTKHDINIKIPEAALLSLAAESSAQLDINASTPAEAGNPVILSKLNANAGIWINYSSVIENKGHRRKVMAAVRNKIPSGWHLLVTASDASGNGKGMLGKPAGRVLLSQEPTEVISDIGSCYTGKGIENGHRLTYSLKTDDSAKAYELPAQHEHIVYVVYTLTDDN